MTSRFGIRIGKKIGSGTFGLVNHMEGFMYDKITGKKYVIKTMNPDFESRNKTLHHEIMMAQKAGSLGIGPRVLTWTPDEKSYIMEYIDGITLGEYIHRGYPCYILVPEIIKMIKILHKNGIYHNDLHDGNIMISNENDIYIIDYGLSSRYPKQNDKFVKDNIAIDRLNKLIAKEGLSDSDSDLDSDS
jgi:Kae1-associated kinase Bud32